MSFESGARVGPYEITGKLGEGGMGEVYRATDTKLQRQVAIKVLPAAFTEDKERLQRFEREAQLLAQLHHPNIASIFGLEESGPIRALVMELVDGPTLADRLEQGPLSIEESLSIARQIAEALEEAHEKGIVHRDLKPQNIKASMEGKVKVLDFGLAKAMDPVGTASGAPSGSQLAASPTLTLGATVQGVILGTAAYMSPEQAKGLPVDKRADVWAFGVVLYEMLVGGTLFAGDTVGDTLAAVIRKDVDLEKLPESTPPPLRRLLRRCLERNPKNRLHSIADARIVIDEVLSGRFEQETSVASVAAAPAPPAWRRLLPWTVAALGLVAAVGSWLAGSGARPAAPLYVDVAPPAGANFHFQGDFGAPAVLSPDGSTIVFGAVDEGASTFLWVRSLVTGETRKLEGTGGATAPFFSADGRSVGYFAGGRMLSIPVTGGTPLRIADAPNGRGGAWLTDGTIVYSPDFRSALQRVKATGGRPEPFTEIDAARHTTHRWPVVTPDGRAIVYLATNHDTARQSEIELRRVRIADGDDRPVISSLYNGGVTDGHLFFVRDGAILAQPFDADSATLSGEPRVVAQSPLSDPSTWRATFSVAAGRLLYSPAGILSGSRISRFDRTGRLLEELAPVGEYADVSISPDGRRLAVSGGTPLDIWLVDLDRRTTGRFTFGTEEDNAPTWSRDGRFLYWVEGYRRLLRRATDGGGAPELVYETEGGENSLYSADVSPDGKTLTVQVGEPPFIQTSDIALLHLGPPARLEPFQAGPGIQNDGVFSPDGRWIVFASAESGNVQVYVAAVPGAGAGPGAKWQVSVEGGTRAVWSADGSEIVYFDQSLNLSRVAVSDDGAGGLRFGAPEAMFGTTLLADAQSFDLAPDGQSLILNHFGEAQSQPLRLVVPWNGGDR